MKLFRVDKYSYFFLKEEENRGGFEQNSIIKNNLLSPYAFVAFGSKWFDMERGDLDHPNVNEINIGDTENDQYGPIFCQMRFVLTSDSALKFAKLGTTAFCLGVDCGPIQNDTLVSRVIEYDLSDEEFELALNNQTIFCKVNPNVKYFTFLAGELKQI